MTSPQALAFSALLKRFRMAAGLTQEDLAEKAGLSASAIGTLERGISRSPRRDTITLLADALALAPAERSIFERSAHDRFAHPHSGGVATEPLGALDADTPPLVGRGAELARIDRFLAAEEPSALLLMGEPGIGKTRLLQEAAARASLLGWAVIRGSCHRRSSIEPYEPFPSALLRFLRARSIAQQRLDLHGCRWLARLLPELTDSGMTPAPVWNLPPDQERRLMFAAVNQLLLNVARPAGTLLVLDDLHWASVDGLDLLTSLLRDGHEQARLRVIGTYRDTDVSTQDAVALLAADLARQGRAEPLNLGPLDQKAASALLDELLAHVPGSTSDTNDQVLRRAGGVPFYLVSFAQELSAHQASAGTCRPTPPPPWQVAASIRQRVGLLRDAARQIVELVALAAGASRGVPHQALVAAADQLGYDETQLAAAVDATYQAHLLADGDHATCACAHELIAEVIVADMTSVRRRLLHRLLGEALETLPDAEKVQHGAALAWHLAQAGMLERALPYALAAGTRAAAVYAHREAEQHFRLALEMAMAQGEQAHIAEAAEKLGSTLIWRGAAEESLTWLDMALQAAQARGDWAAVARLALALSRPYVDQGRPQGGIVRLEQLRSLLDAHEAPRQVATLDLALTHLCYGAGQYAKMLDAAERALVAAQVLGDVELHAHALWRRGSGRVLLGRLRHGLADLEQSATLAVQAGHLPTAMWAWHSATLASLHMGDAAAAETAAARALDVATTLGAPDWIAKQLVLGAFVAFERGDMQVAEDMTIRAERIVPEFHADWAVSSVMLARGRLALASHDATAATRALDVALEHANRSGDLQLIRQTQHLLAERDLLIGEISTALARLEPLLDRHDLVELDVNPLLPVLARVHLQLGALIPAVEVITGTCVRLRAQEDRLTLAEALRVQALIATQQGNHAEARTAIAEALELSRAMGCCAVEARAMATSEHVRQLAVIND